MAFKGALENLALRRSLTPIFARKGESGQALIEFAFVFPLLFVFILLIVDFGFALDRREVIQHAVREGARAGAVGEDIHFITDEQSGGILNASNVNVCYENENGGSVGDAGDTVRVTGNYSYNLRLGGGAFLSGLIPPIVMKPSAGARLEKTASGVVVQC
jgi:Flp pilus assembly protein TadG